jgi:hypothetical protein
MNVAAVVIAGVLGGLGAWLIYRRYRKPAEAIVPDRADARDTLPEGVATSRPLMVRESSGQTAW